MRAASGRVVPAMPIETAAGPAGGPGAPSRKVSVVGIGYVGLPVAMAFARHGRVVAFDIDGARVDELRRGVDRNRDVDAGELAAADILFTDDAEALSEADFHIVAAPTPLDATRRPNLKPLLDATGSVGKRLQAGDIVVFESTVYPGTTREVCMPLLEEASGLVCGTDFTVGYSPERIAPGDSRRSFAGIVKIVAAQDEATLDVVAAMYRSVVTAGIHRAPSVEVAEGAKIAENVQRDINIALMNELALIFGRMGIDTRDTIAAAATKWNFHAYVPGLVGGHCIGVDPHYLIHKAALLEHDSRFVLAGRQINDRMGAHIASEVVKYLVRCGRAAQNATVTVLGFAFKENVADLRNTRVVDLVRELESYNLVVQVSDPHVDPEQARRQYGISPQAPEALLPADAVVLAVAHAEFAAAGWAGIRARLRGGRGGVFDVKCVLDRASRPDGIDLWRL